MATLRNHTAEYQHWQPEEVKIINGQPVRFCDVCVHEFTVGDAEDPILVAEAPLAKWQQSEAGAWIMAHAVKEPYWTQHMDYNTWGHRFQIIARLSDQDQTFWRLKWAGRNK